MVWHFPLGICKKPYGQNRTISCLLRHTHTYYIPSLLPSLYISTVSTWKPKHLMYYRAFAAVIQCELKGKHSLLLLTGSTSGLKRYVALHNSIQLHVYVYAHTPQTFAENTRFVELEYCFSQSPNVYRALRNECNILPVSWGKVSWLQEIMSPTRMPLKL